MSRTTCRILAVQAARHCRYVMLARRESKNVTRHCLHVPHALGKSIFLCSSTCENGSGLAANGLTNGASGEI